MESTTRVTNSHQADQTNKRPPAQSWTAAGQPAHRSLLTVQQTAALLGIHANTVRSWTDEGRLTCLRINTRGDRRYARDELDRFLAHAGALPETDAPGDRRTADHVAARQGARAGGRSAHRQQLLHQLAAACIDKTDVDGLLQAAAAILHREGGYRAVALIATDGQVQQLFGRTPIEAAVRRRRADRDEPAFGRMASTTGVYRAYLPIAADGTKYGTLVISGTRSTRTSDEADLLAAVATQLAVAVRMRQQLTDASRAQHRAEMLMAASTEMASQLDLTRILDQLVVRAAELFGAEHAAVFRRLPAGAMRTRATYNLSNEFQQIIEHASTLPVTETAFDERRVVSAINFPDDPRGIELRPAFRREGINTVTVAPLLSDAEPLGVLALYHDHEHNWSDDDLALLEQLSHQASGVLRNAQNFSQMATWAAQLQSIQQLGARLTRLRSVNDIGQAICAELNQLIDFHNVRVYRLAGAACVPVAFRGQIGEYEGEDSDQLRIEVGEGVTGWVARYGVAQNVGDAANDRRSKTIPGTEDGLDESLLLAPMLFEDEVIGVIVLAKLGLHQFTADDLRLLEIYASIAAQAMANADTTEQLRSQSQALERQLNSQRELLRVTESLLGTLDTQALLEQIADSLGALLRVDNICVDIHDEQEHVLRPIFARGVHAAQYMAETLPDDQGEGGHVIQAGEPLLVEDELSDVRVAHFQTTGPVPGSLIIAPLRSGERILGVLTIERLGDVRASRFNEEEFELVKLFAAHVSIALRNAEAHRAVELRAETDTLTGLWNHGALTQNLDQLVEQDGRFAALMVDLDHFKRYNDALGHQAGNVMLQRVASVLRGACRESDPVFRYGGDEFMVLLPSAALAGARTVAAKVRAAVADINDDHRLPVPLACSIGISVYPRDGANGAEIILAADRACYAAKRAGRDRIATATEGLALAAEFQPTEPTSAESTEAAYLSLATATSAA